LKSSADRPHYVNAIDEIKGAILKYMEDRRLAESQPVDQEFVSFIHAKASQAVEKYKVSNKSANIIETTEKLHLFSGSPLPHRDGVALLKNIRNTFSAISIIVSLDFI